MIITYIRSSSLSSYQFCQQQFFIEYNLGFREEEHYKTRLGTVVHKTCEGLAKANLEKGEVEDSILGKFNLNSNPYELLTKAYNYYMSTHSRGCNEEDHEFCRASLEKVFSKNKGEFDPRFRKILAIEKHFDIVIDQPWAEYDYDGLKGKLAIKGTIDLITEANKDTIESLDWKTGQKKNWSTGKEKTYSDLCKDPQLRIYHYALSKLYPQYKFIQETIFFINDFPPIMGGAFTIPFDESDLVKTEELLKERFEEIKNCNKPQLVAEKWKCKYLCPWSKKTFEEKGIKSLKEYQNGKFTPKGEDMAICRQVEYAIEKKGIEWVTLNYKNPTHDVSNYNAPGEK